MHVIVTGLRGIPAVEGGVETHCEHLYPLLCRHGHNIEVICRTPYVDKQTNKNWHGVRLTRLWSPVKPALEAFAHTFLAVLYAALKRPDILHIHAVGPSLMVPIARLLGLKVIVTHHGFDYEREKWGGVASRALRLGERFAARYAHQTIVISEVISQRLREMYGKVCPIIPNGVDIPQPVESNEFLSKNCVTAGKYFLMVGRFVPEKRITDAIEAFSSADLNGWHLLIAGRCEGEGEYPAAVRTLAAATPGVELVGFQTGQALQELYGHAAALLLPSSHEGLPLTLLEALSHGIRVVVSDIPAHTTLKLRQECYFVLGDIHQLSRKLVQISGEDWSDTQADAQRAWVAEQFSWTRIAADTASEYERVLSN